MDPYRGFHRRFLGKRQGIGGVLGGLVPNGATSSAAKQDTTTSAASQNPGNPIVGAFTSLIDGVPTPVLSPSGPSSPTTSSLLTPLSSSSTGSTTSSASSAQRTTSTSSTSTSTSTTPIAPTSTPTPTSSAADIVYTSSDGTSVVYVTSTLPAPSATVTPSPSFLQNPSLEGGVFTLVGIAALIIIFVVVTWTLRKRRRDRLDRDFAAAVTFDPVTDHYERQESSMEKHRLSGSSSGHGHGFGHGYGMQPAYAPPHGPLGYGQYPAPAYHPSPNPAPFQAPSPTVPQPAAQGGANLARKFSDRKPVPPLLPTPAYDPSNAHVSIPPQFYQQ